MFHFKRRQQAMALCAALSFPFAAMAADGDFDTTFASDGTTRFEIANPNNAPLANLDMLSVLAIVNGKIMAAGIPEYDDDANPTPPVFVARLALDGTVEFTTTINLTTSTPGLEFGAESVVVAPNGNLFVSGGRANPSFQAYIQRYSSTGTLLGSYARPTSISDQSFCGAGIVDNAGKLVFPCVVGFDEANPMASRAALLRFNSTLTLDTTFGGDGEVIFPTQPAGGCNDGFEAQSVVQMPSGDYVVAANCQNVDPINEDIETGTVHIIKFTVDGSPVTVGFANAGILDIPVENPAEPDINSMAVDPLTGKVYLGGEDFHDQNPSESQTYLTRFSPTTGVIDSGFGDDGVIERLTSSGFGFTIRGLIPQAQERVVVLAGNELYRLNSNGSLDNSFARRRAFEFQDGFKGGNLFGFLATDGGSRALVVGGVEDFCVENPTACGSGVQLTEALAGRIKLTTDTTPDAFTLIDRTAVPLNSFTQSNSITISGIEGSVPVSVSGDQSSVYSIGCAGGSFTSSVGSITNGQSVCVAHTSAGTGNTPRNTTLTIGAISDTFTSTTLTPDTTPDGYVNFTSQTGVPLSSLRTSNAQVISGINSPASISVSGVQGSLYDVGCDGSPVATVGTINNGQSVCVLHTSSGTASTTVTSTLTIGGVARSFASTTAAGPDTTPNAFAFTDVSGVATGTPRGSNTITIAGITAPAPISISGADGTYRINGSGNFVSTPGMVNNGDTVQLRMTSSINPSTAVSTTLTVGGVSDTFTLTTGTVDTSPAPFTFPNITNGNSGAVRTSLIRTISGLSGAVPVELIGGGASARLYVNGIDVTTNPGTVSNGDTVQLQLTVSSVGGTTLSARLRVGTYSTLWSVTASIDTTPAAFVFPNVTNAVAGRDRPSVARGITSINVPVPLSLSGDPSARVFVNDVDRTAEPGMVVRGDRLRLQLTGPASGNSASATVTVGGYSTTWTVSTP